MNRYWNDGASIEPTSSQPEGTKEISSDLLALAIFRATNFLHVSAKRNTK